MMRVTGVLALTALLAWSWNSASDDTAQPRLSGRVVDAATGKGIPNAIVIAGDGEHRSEASGKFVLDGAGSTPVVRARAVGYARVDVQAQTLRAPGGEISLTPFRPKAVYLSVYGIGSTVLRTAALALADTTEVNALVIDVKGDRGIVPYRSAIPLATTIGAQRVITIRDLPQLIAGLKQRGLYAIARQRQTPLRSRDRRGVRFRGRRVRDQPSPIVAAAGNIGSWRIRLPPTRRA